MVFSALLIIFLCLKWWGQVPILRSIQYVTFKYGDFQKTSRISLREPSISINSIMKTQSLVYKIHSPSGRYPADITGRSDPGIFYRLIIRSGTSLWPSSLSVHWSVRWSVGRSVASVCHNYQKCIKVHFQRSYRSTTLVSFPLVGPLVCWSVRQFVIIS